MATSKSSCRHLQPVIFPFSHEQLQIVQMAILKLFINSLVSRIMCVWKHIYRYVYLYIYKNTKIVYRKQFLHTTSNLSFQLRLGKQKTEFQSFPVLLQPYHIFHMLMDI